MYEHFILSFKMNDDSERTMVELYHTGQSSKFSTNQAPTAIPKKLQRTVAGAEFDASSALFY